MCDGLGIGSKGTLPWPRLSNEMKYFRRMTTGCKDSAKRNAVVMGRRTWESIPEQHRPLGNRLNIVLTRNKDYAINSQDVLVMPSLQVFGENAVLNETARDKDLILRYL